MCRGKVPRNVAQLVTAQKAAPHEEEEGREGRNARRVAVFADEDAAEGSPRRSRGVDPMWNSIMKRPPGRESRGAVFGV